MSTPEENARAALGEYARKQDELNGSMGMVKQSLDDMGDKISAMAQQLADLAAMLQSRGPGSPR